MAVSRHERTRGRWIGFGLDRVSRRTTRTASLERGRDELPGRQKRYLESLLEISPTAIVTLDLERRVTSWNLAAEELFGYTAAEATGRKLEDLVARQEDMQAEAAAYYEQLGRGQRFHAVTRRMRKDGTVVDVDLFAVPVTVEDELSGHVVIYYDISALKQAEKRYRDLIEQLPLVTYIDEPAVAPSIYISPQIEGLLGYSAEEWLADPDLFVNLLHPDDRERVLVDHDRVFAAGESSWSFEYRLIARDGRTVWLRDDAVVVRDEEGTALYVQGFLMDVTKRKETEEALRKSEERFRAMFEDAPIGVAWGPLEESAARPISGAAGSGLYTRNRAYMEMLGYTEQELSSMHFTEYTHPDDLPKVLELYGELIAGERDRYEVAMRYLGKDGRTIWAQVAESALGGEQGTPRFGLTMVQDITERRLAHEALQASEAELRRQKQYLEALLELSPAAIVTTDLDDNITAWNAAARELFGYTQVEVLGHNIDDLIAKSDEQHAEAVEVNQRATAGSQVRLVTRRTRKDGTLVDVDLRAAPILVGGRMVGSYAIYNDLSDVHRQKQYFESLLEISPSAIITVDLDDRVTSWNPAAEKLFGYTREEAIGRDVDELLAASVDLGAEAREVNRRGSEHEYRLITRRTRKNGSLVDVQLLVAPVLVEGQLVGRYGIYHDVSELQRAREAAEEATEAKSTFLATMSHEIRTPMNAVLGMTGLLLDTELTQEQRGFAEVIRTSGDALLGIINDILDLSKIEAGKLELERRPFVLRDCVEAALDLVAASAAAKALELASLLDPRAPVTLVGDAKRLGQILANLLTNAVKFTDEGEVVLSVESRRVVEGERLEEEIYELRFAVRDTGIGIPKERIDRLFQSFSQVDASTTRRYGGTGLGLAISKRLSEMMGGTMWVESKPGQGSAFHFTVKAEAAAGPELVDVPGEHAQLEGKRLLVVDDNAANCEVLKRQASSWGMVPRDTGSPTEALEWIRRGDPFDAAILDMQMPKMDGLALAREIRRFRDARVLPLVMLTSLGRREQDVHAGVDFAAHLTKPIKASQLYEALMRAFGEISEEVTPVGPGVTSGSEATGGAPLQVLVADANAVNQQLALALLTKMGYRADVATNGAEVLEALARQPYDVVLMDVEMPVMDGLEASRRINQECPAGQRPRIIAMTANAMQGDRETCLAAGMDDYLSKPIRREELAVALAGAETRAVSKEDSATADEPHDPGTVDLAELETAVGDPTLVRELISTFLMDAPGLVGELRSSFEQGDLEELRRVAHTLKSNGRTFGATRLAALSEELELSAQTEQLSGAVDLVTRIEREYARVEAALGALAGRA
jgi:PAS domain S-box-containing protein